MSPVSIGRSPKVGCTCEYSRVRGSRYMLQDCCPQCFPGRLNVTPFSVGRSAPPLAVRLVRGGQELPSPSCPVPAAGISWLQTPPCPPRRVLLLQPYRLLFPGHSVLSSPGHGAFARAVLSAQKGLSPPRSLVVALDPSAASQASLPRSPLSPRLGRAPPVSLPFLPSAHPC